jgi:4a-hydroxytetrahydrobiopterin dehydratase
MMDDLAEKTCTPCRGGIPPLTQEDAERLHVQVPDWELRDDAHRIERSFRFANFRGALSFVQRIGDLAETQGHHPDISFGWGYATVSLRTKKICTKTISSWPAGSIAYSTPTTRIES